LAASRSILPSAAVVAVRAGGVRGFGSPSSVTAAVNVTGAETLARDTGATTIVGGEHAAAPKERLRH
jgi:hypothetical protein